jgi:hypothetical protein
MISPKAPPAWLRRKQSLAHLAIEEKKKRGPRAPSQNFRQDQNRKTTASQKWYMSMQQVESLGLGGVLKESPLTTH